MVSGIFKYLLITLTVVMLSSVYACGNRQKKHNKNNGISTKVVKEKEPETKQQQVELQKENRNNTTENSSTTTNVQENENAYTNKNSNAKATNNNVKKDTEPTKTKFLKAKSIETLPHSQSSYTQGLFFYNGVLYESNGQYGQSNLRTVDLKTGKTIKQTNFDAKYFAEGSCIFENNIYVLTWQENSCIVLDKNTLNKVGELKYNGEGWGLTTNGKDLIVSNGSADIFFVDPMTFSQKKSIKVKLDGKALYYINELEYINNEIWANVYGEDYIITINPNNGNVTAVIDCRDLYPSSSRSKSADVFNGIAYNPADKSIYVTGKYWPYMYKIDITEQ